MPKVATKTSTKKVTAVKKAVGAKVKVEEVKVKAVDYNRAVGRRKCATARVRISRGTGKIIINGVDYETYFTNFTERQSVMQPLVLLGKEKDLDITVKVVGGGKKGQSDAVRHGIARALVVWNEDFRKSLKTNSLLTRDARVKERKKFGLKKARKAPTWSKR